jgi:hypothetical protein
LQYDTQVSTVMLSEAVEPDARTRPLEPSAIHETEATCQPEGSVTDVEEPEPEPEPVLDPVPELEPLPEVEPEADEDEDDPTVV